MTKKLDYPLRFEPIYVEKVWGGNRLNKVLNKNSPYEKTGESWEISAVKENTSQVTNGAFAGHDLRSICNQYPTDLMGKRIYQRFDGEFPLLIKFLDAHIPLSVQVHPDDAMAEAYDSFGKNEMWYVLNAEKDAKIYLGFLEDESRETIAEAIKNNTLVSKIKDYHPTHGDAFLVPAREIHAIGADVLVAEIQQTSDVTFRLYDWERDYDDDHFRELHIEESLDTLNYQASKNLYYPKDKHYGDRLIHNQYFKTNSLEVNGKLNRDTYALDSFVIYMVVKGKISINSNSHIEVVEKGETVLLPYNVGGYSLEGDDAEILEIYV